MFAFIPPLKDAGFPVHNVNPKIYKCFSALISPLSDGDFPPIELNIFPGCNTLVLASFVVTPYDVNPVMENFLIYETIN